MTRRTQDGPRSTERLAAAAQAAGNMTAALVDVFQRFLDDAAESQVIVISDIDAPDQYVQFKRLSGRIYGEVGSREWMSTSDEDRPLGDGAKARLAALRFTGGRRTHNYGCDHLAQSAPYLAEVTAQLFKAAYGAPLPASPRIACDIPSVQAAAGDLSRPLTFVPRPQSANRHRTLTTSPVRAAPALRARLERALRSNLAQIGTTTEELVAIRAEVECAESWDGLPGWVKQWVTKAEEGPLRVPLQPH